MWDLPRPGIELVSPALAGRLLAPVAPGKSSASLLWFNYFDIWPCWLLLAGKRVEDCVGFRHMSLQPTSHPLEFSHMPQTIWNEPGKYLSMARVCKERCWWRHHIALRLCHLTTHACSIIHREEYHVKMMSETAVIQLLAKEWQGSHKKLGRGKGIIFL